MCTATQNKRIKCVHIPFRSQSVRKFHLLPPPYGNFGRLKTKVNCWIDLTVFEIRQHALQRFHNFPRRMAVEPFLQLSFVGLQLKTIKNKCFFFKSQKHKLFELAQLFTIIVCHLFTTFDNFPIGGSRNVTLPLEL